MPKVRSKQVLGIKTEATQGTAIALVATDYLLVEDATISAITEKNIRDAKRSSLDKLAHIVGQRYVEITFKTEVKTNGTANGATGQIYAPLGAALQACGFTEVATASTNVTYAPTSTALAGFYGPGKSVTIEVWNDGIKHTAAGCMGDVKFSGEAGKLAYYEFRFMGKYAAPADTAAPSQTYVTSLPPVFESATLTLQTLAAVVTKVEWSTNNEVSLRADVSAATSVLGFLITARDPRGTVDPETESVATHDFFTRLVNGTEGSLTWRIGTVAGNITTFTMTKTQYDNVSYGERNGILIFDVPVKFNQNTGDDYVSIVQT